MHVQERNENSQVEQPLEITSDLLLRIAKYNGNMTDKEVAYALLLGHRIYTSFRSYKI